MRLLTIRVRAAWMGVTMILLHGILPQPCAEASPESSSAALLTRHTRTSGSPTLDLVGVTHHHVSAAASAISAATSLRRFRSTRMMSALADTPAYQPSTVSPVPPAPARGVPPATDKPPPANTPPPRQASPPSPPAAPLDPRCQPVPSGYGFLQGLEHSEDDLTCQLTGNGTYPWTIASQAQACSAAPWCVGFNVFPRGSCLKYKNTPLRRKWADAPCFGFYVKKGPPRSTVVSTPWPLTPPSSPPTPPPDENAPCAQFVGFLFVQGARFATAQLSVGVPPYTLLGAATACVYIGFDCGGFDTDGVLAISYTLDANAPSAAGRCQGVYLTIANLPQGFLSPPPGVPSVPEAFPAVAPRPPAAPPLRPPPLAAVNGGGGDGFPVAAVAGAVGGGVAALVIVAAVAALFMRRSRQRRALAVLDAKLSGGLDRDGSGVTSSNVMLMLDLESDDGAAASGKGSVSMTASTASMAASRALQKEQSVEPKLVPPPPQSSQGLWSFAGGMQASHTPTSSAVADHQLSGWRPHDYSDSLHMPPQAREQTSPSGLTGVQSPGGGASPSDSDPHANAALFEVLSAQMLTCNARLKDEQLEVFELLGRGGSGSVYRALWKGLPVAAKMMLLQANLGAKTRRQMLEATLGIGFSHGNVVSTYMFDLKPLVEADAHQSAEVPRQLWQNTDMANTTWQLVILQELCAGGSLRQLMAGPRGLCLQAVIDTPERSTVLAHMLQLAHDIASGLEHLHSRNVVHSDLTPSNVLLQDAGFTTRPAGLRWVAKVADFGLSIAFEDGCSHVSRVFAGTPHYIAPETQASGILSKSSDIFTFGILLYEMAAGSLDVLRVLDGAPPAARPVPPAKQPVKPPTPCVRGCAEAPSRDTGGTSGSVSDATASCNALSTEPHDGDMAIYLLNATVAAVEKAATLGVGDQRQVGDVGRHDAPSPACCLPASALLPDSTLASDRPGPFPPAPAELWLRDDGGGDDGRGSDGCVAQAPLLGGGRGRRSANVLPPLSLACPAEYRALVRACLSPSPQDRPSVADLRERLAQMMRAHVPPL